MIEESDILPRLVAFSQCLCEKLEEYSPEAPVCFCGVMAGADLSTEWAEGGQAWVRLVSAFPSTTFPEPNVDATPCAVSIAYQIEMGVIRCMPAVNALTGKADDGYMLNVVRQQMSDMEAMKKAILCCLDDDFPLVLSEYTPWGPQGNAYGGIWTFAVTGVKG